MSLSLFHFDKNRSINECYEKCCQQELKRLGNEAVYHQFFCSISTAIFTLKILTDDQQRIHHAVFYVLCVCLFFSSFKSFSIYNTHNLKKTYNFHKNSNKQTKLHTHTRSPYTLNHSAIIIDE